MSIDIGITGLAGSGKTTIFNALTRGKADTESLTPHIGIAKVPEPRLKMLDDVLRPKRVVSAEVRYIDTGAPIKDKAISGQLLSQLSNTDALINVIRPLTNENKPPIEVILGIEQDIATTDAELAFSDLALLERRLERITTSLRGAKQAEHQDLLREQELLMKVKAD
ncbi:MAG: 50S ribosome-binding GTPase, partial [Dehalococcoidales bacterium]|nr:50S ribosome-binding GTPase [Dehalococcoidales bacterium]